MKLVYWDYYSSDYDRYVNMIRINQQFGKPVIFAGGAWTWKGMAPDNSFSMAASQAALRACRAEGFRENKPHGFGVQDIRLGGAIQRLKRSRTPSRCSGSCLSG